MTAENACVVMRLPRGMYELDVFTTEGPRINWITNYSGLHNRLTWYRPCIIWWPDGHITQLSELNNVVGHEQPASLSSDIGLVAMEQGK